jgi:hypothetical protein
MKDKSREAGVGFVLKRRMKDIPREAGVGFVLKSQDKGQITRVRREICP